MRRLNTRTDRLMHSCCVFYFGFKINIMGGMPLGRSVGRPTDFGWVRDENLTELTDFGELTVTMYK